MACNREIGAMLALHQNSLAAYSTRQLKEELSRRRKDHIRMRFRVKRQIRRYGRLQNKRQKVRRKDR